MAQLERIGRRAWLSRMAGGAVAAWASVGWERGRETWAGWLGVPRVAAQPAPDQILPVEMELEFQGNVVPVAAFVVVRGQEIAVVDTLVPDNADRIGAMIEQAGLDWRAVRHVILTHWHFDHAGSANEVAARAPQAAVWAGAADIPQIEMERPIGPVEDGDEIFGLRVVATPGHTMGHISLLDPTGSTLLTGDAVFNIGGELTFPPAQSGEDAAATLESVQKLGALGVERALFAHGVPILQGASASLARLAAAGSAVPDINALADHRHNCLLHS